MAACEHHTRQADIGIWTRFGTLYGVRAGPSSQVGAIRPANRALHPTAQN